MKRNTHTTPLIVMIAGLAMTAAASAQTTITQDFESTTAPDVPSGWTTVGVGGDGTYATTAGTGNPGQSGNLDWNGSKTSPPSVYLVNNGVAFDATRPISGSFDFYVNEEGNYSNANFVFGDVQDGLAGNAGEFINVWMCEQQFDTRARVYDGANNILFSGDGNNAYAFKTNEWVSASFTWTPTSGTTGNFSVLLDSPSYTNSPMVVTGFTFDSPSAFFGFGTGNAAVRFDNISLTGFPFTGVYWDTNGTTEGAGNPATGTWDGTLTNWNPSADGTAASVAWPSGGFATFSAGSDAADPYTVTVRGTQDFSGLKFDNGTPTLTGGTLRISDDSSFAQVNSGITATIASAISDDGGVRALSKGGTGTLILTGDNSGAVNSSMSLDAGFTQFAAPNSIPGSGKNLTINTDGTLVFGTSFGSANIAGALDRVVTTSTGTITVDNFNATNFDFDTPDLADVYLGAVGAVNYSGTLTPDGTTYRLGGGGGTLTMDNLNAITGANSLVARGKIILASNNDYSGATTVAADGSLSLLGSTGTSGVTLNAGAALTVGNNDSLGAGTLTIGGLATIAAQGTVAVANPVAANADFNIGGDGTLTLGTVTVNNNRVITNENSTGTTTIGSIGVTSGNRNLTFSGSGTTVISGDISQGTGSLTVSGGTLMLSSGNAGSGTTSLNAATLQFNSDSNGGLASGTLTISQNAAVLQAVNADRAIANNILLNASPTISGTQSLTLNGTTTINNNPPSPTASPGPEKC